MKLILASGALLLVAGCGVGGESPDGDPRKGWVKVDNGVYKHCAGTTLIFQINKGGSAVPNSPECAE